MFEFNFDPACTTRTIQAFTSGWLGETFACNDAHEMSAWFRGFARFMRREVPSVFAAHKVVTS